MVETSHAASDDYLHCFLLSPGPNCIHNPWSVQFIITIFCDGVSGLGLYQISQNSLVAKLKCVWIFVHLNDGVDPPFIFVWIISGISVPLMNMGTSYALFIHFISFQSIFACFFSTTVGGFWIMSPNWYPVCHETDTLVTVPLCEWIGSIVGACNICRDCEHQLSPSYSILLLVWPVPGRGSSCVTAPDTTVARQPPKFHNSIILQQLNTAPVHCGKHYCSNIQISV